MSENGKTLLLIGACLNFAIALLHIGIIIIGAPAYLYFGALDLANLANQGSQIPTLITSALALLFSTFAGYALAGAGVLPRLPLLKPGLLLIGSVYVLRGLIVMLDIIRLVQKAGYPFRQTVFSAVALFIGLLYLIGTFQQWKYLSPKIDRV